MNKQAEIDDELITKAYVDQFHQDNERSRRGLGTDFYNESKDLVNNNQDNNLNDEKLTNLNSITVNRNPSLDCELGNKKCVDDKLDKNTILRFNQTLEKYLKVSVGKDTYNLTIHDEIRLGDITEIKYPNKGYALLPKRRIKKKQ